MLENATDVIASKTTASLLKKNLLVTVFYAYYITPKTQSRG